MKPSLHLAAAPLPWTILALLLTLPAAAQAQTLQGQQTTPQPRYQPAPPQGEAAMKDWTFRIGAGGLFQPEYEGSDKYEISPVPMVMVSYRDLVFLRGPTLGVNAFTWKGARPGDKLQLGPLIRYQPGRDQDDSDALRGMGNIDAAAELGIFVTYSTGPWSTGLTVFRDVSDSHDGLTARLTAGNRLPLGPRLQLRSEIATTWADENYTETFFGVTAAQSARSGLRQYQPGSGFKDAGITFDLDYNLTESWGVTGRLGYKRMLGDAADSPLVKDVGSANQFTSGMFVSYKF